MKTTLFVESSKSIWELSSRSPFFPALVPHWFSFLTTVDMVRCCVFFSYFLIHLRPSRWHINWKRTKDFSFFVARRRAKKKTQRSWKDSPRKRSETKKNVSSIIRIITFRSEILRKKEKPTKQKWLGNTVCTVQMLYSAMDWIGIWKRK